MPENFGEKLSSVEIHSDQEDLKKEINDFGDDDITRQILENGNPEKLSELADFHKWTPEQAKL